MAKKKIDLTKLPRLTRSFEEYDEEEEGGGSKFKQMVDEQKAKFAEMSSAMLVTNYEQYRSYKDRLKAQLKEVNAVLAALEALSLAKFEADGIQKLQLANGVNLAIEKDVIAKVTDWDAFRPWLEDHGYKNRMLLMAATITKITRELLEDGESEPPGVEAFTRDKFVLRGRGK